MDQTNTDAQADDCGRSLRERAARLLAGNAAPMSPAAPGDARDLAEELAVHQAELELQNEALREAQEALERTRDRFTALYEHAPVGYVVLDDSGIVRQANATWLSMLGRDGEDVRGAPFAKFLEPDDAPIFLSRFRAFFRNPEEKQIVVRVLRRGQPPLHACIEARPHTLTATDAGTGNAARTELMIIVTDISALRAAQAQVEHINRVLKAIRNVNQLIVREKDPMRLLQQSCEMLVETRGYRGACAVMPVRQGKLPLAGSAGWNGEFASFTDRVAQGWEPPCVPHARAAEDGLAVMNADENCSGCPLRRVGNAGQSVCMELRHSGRVLGFIGVTLIAGVPFSDEEESLFREVAGDVALGLHTIEIENQAKRDRELLDETGQMARVGGWEVNLADNTVVWTSTTRAIHEVPDDHVPTLDEALDFFPEARETLREAIRRTKEEGIPYDLELPFVTAKGRKLWTHTIGKPEMDGSRCVRLHGIFQDITKRKEAIEAMRETEARFRSVIETIPDLLWLKDVNGVYLACNRRFEKFFGAPQEEIIGKTDYDFVPRDLADFFRARDQDALVRGQPSRNEEWVTFADDGHRELLETIKTPLHDHQGNLVGVLGIGRDITARKHDELRIESLSRFASENPNPVLRVSRSGRIEYANAAAEGLADVIGTAADGDAPSPWWQHVAKALESGEPQDAEIPVGDRLFLATFAPIPEHGYVNVYARDATEMRTMEIQLRQAQKLESIGTLAGGVAHEINNPINGIMNYAQLIRDRIGEQDETVDEFAGEIIQETERVATIVKNLLSFARQEKQAHSPARMCDIVNGTVSLVRTILRHDQITLVVDVPEDLPQLKCRSQQIQQVIMNLVINARDALSEKYPGYDENKTIIITAVSQHSPVPAFPHPLIRLTVEDHGPGIRDDVRARMFDPFFTTKPRSKGTGLGLAISHGIVAEHDGRILVESEPGAWTRFHVELPIDTRGKPERGSEE